MTTTARPLFSRIPAPLDTDALTALYNAIPDETPGRVRMEDGTALGRFTDDGEVYATHYNGQYLITDDRTGTTHWAETLAEALALFTS